MATRKVNQYLLTKMDEQTAQQYMETTEKLNELEFEHDNVEYFIRFVERAVADKLEHIYKKYGDILTTYQSDGEAYAAQHSGECRRVPTMKLYSIFATKNADVEERLKKLLDPLKEENRERCHQCEVYLRRYFNFEYRINEEERRKEREQREAEKKQRRLERKLANKEAKRVEQEKQKRIENTFTEIMGILASGSTSCEEFDNCIKSCGEVFGELNNYKIKVDKLDKKD